MRRVAMAGAAVLLLAGCGSVSGSPVSVRAANELFDACNVPADSLRAADVSPRVVQSPPLTDHSSDTEWDDCTWAGEWYFLNVFSTTHTFGEIQNNPNSKDFKPVTIGDRTAVSYVSTLIPDGLTCEVAFPWAHGSAIVSIDTMGNETSLEDPCVVAVRTAKVLDPVLPR